MSKRIYVGNIPYSATTDELKELFGQFGTVNDVHIAMDRDTGRPRGFAFVEMDDQGAQAAIDNLNETQMGGRNLRVNEARPREGGSGGRW